MITDVERDKIVKYLGKQLVAMANVAAELEEVGDLANAKEEAKRIAVKAGEDRDQALADRDAALEELSLLEAQIKKNREKASDLIAVANVRSQAILSAAQIKSEGMVVIAQQKTVALGRELDLLKHNHSDVLTQYGHQEEAARNRVVVITGELAKLEKRLSG